MQKKSMKWLFQVDQIIEKAMNKYRNDSEWYGSSDLRKCATPRITLSQAKYFVSSVGSHKVKSFIPP